MEKEVKDESLCISVKEAAQIMGMSPLCIRMMVKDGIIPGKCYKRKGHRDKYIIFRAAFYKLISNQ